MKGSKQNPVAGSSSGSSSGGLVRTETRKLVSA